MALSQRFVDRIFARMLVRYGAAWLRMWEGVEMDAVKADWAEELSGFETKPNALKHGLEHLPPDRPPSVAQFRDLCRRAPMPVPPALPAPKADPAVIEKAVALAKRSVRSAGGLQWAVTLQERERRGERLTIHQRKAWREALRILE